MKKYGPLVVFLVLVVALSVGCNNATTPPSSVTPTVTPTESPTPTQSSQTGVVYGKVTDSITEEVLSGVTITIKTKGQTVYTDQNGLYRVEGLSPGDYTFTFERGGYRQKKKDVSVKAGEEIELNVKLEKSEVVVKKTISKDTYITSEKPNTNFGKDFSLHLAKNSRILLWFEILPTVPVSSAKLYLHRKSASGNGTFLTCDIYPLIQEWDPDVATWNNASTTDLWFSEGGVYTNVKVGHGYFTTVTDKWEEIDITDAFKYWRTRMNVGLILITNNTDIAEDFNSYEDGSNAPYVVIKYYIP